MYKATANVDEAKKMFEHYTLVKSPEILALRNEVLAKRLPRRVLVQPRIALSANNEAEFIEYEASSTGMIKSFIDRYGVEA